MYQITKQKLIHIANPSTLEASVFLKVPWNRTSLGSVISFVATNAEPDIADKLGVIEYNRVGKFDEETALFLLLVTLDVQDLFEPDEIVEHQNQIAVP